MSFKFSLSFMGTSTLERYVSACESECVVCVSISTVPPGYNSDGLNMEVRSNFKAKVRYFSDNGEHEWPLLPSNKTQNLICNGCP